MCATLATTSSTLKRAATISEVRKVTAEEWKEKIVLSCKDAGTYRECFTDAIETLAATLSNRDEAQRLYEKQGSKPVVVYTNKNGQENIVKNPILVTIDDLNKTALTYWRDLGLTPKGLKAIDESAVKAKKTTGLQEMLKAIDG